MLDVPRISTLNTYRIGLISVLIIRFIERTFIYYNYHFKCIIKFV
ncbi:hypothetical protein SH1V18_20250 [Vallitalea longa]|uniref:Uncharacterized protein n=1 Tax=Vallitalea longa TaxID=2936439 RepID=A0A9W5Y964_9FIRM|nr:hypothetical protein SH1V18_20250 [Vallitalea longa]